jgi:hypothetical protein
MIGGLLTRYYLIFNIVDLKIERWRLGMEMHIKLTLFTVVRNRLGIIFRKGRMVTKM